MKNIIPRVAAIHDLSGFGRCALTVIIPVLSSMGVQVCPLPTAILSTHSGGFDDFTFHDFSDSMKAYADHWKSIGVTFDCIYSGFLGSANQIDIVAEFFEDFKGDEKQLIVVDPVMGDEGVLYKTYTDEMQKKMRLLVEKAHIITPNFTEACFLTNRPYTEEPLDETEIKHLLMDLSSMGPETVVITGVKLDKNRLANVSYNRIDDIYWRVIYHPVPVEYPGTGDVFTSVLIGSLLRGDNLPMAIDRATQFISYAVRITYGYRTPVREGIMLEKVLPWFGEEMISVSYERI